MDFIGRLVEAYAQFYRADFAKLDSAYAVLRPLSTAIKVVVESDPRIGEEDLLLLVSGAVNDDQERVRADQAEGFDPIITNKDLGDYGTRLALSRQKIEEFARAVINDCLLLTVMVIEPCFVSERIVFVQQPVFTISPITVVVQSPKFENCFLLYG